jgi:hypothetical protein
MDFGHFFPLICDEFLFVFAPGDLSQYPDDIPPAGVWGRAEELEANSHLLDKGYLPGGDPGLEITYMELELGLSGELRECNLVAAPPEALEGFVTFDLRVETAGGVTYLVNTRPEFFFAHAGTSIAATDTTYYWCIWQVYDSPFEQPEINGTSPDERERKEGKLEKAKAEAKSPAGPAIEHATWGVIKALYSK